MPAGHRLARSASLTALGMAMHNLLALTDPTLDRFGSRRARPVILESIEALLAAVRLPETRGEVLARHVITDAFLGLQRRDTVVKNWAYTYRFFGRKPPANVVAMPTLRFVRQTHSRTPLDGMMDAIVGLDLESRCDALVARSPITALFAFCRRNNFVFSPAIIAALSDPAIRDAAARQMVHSGLSQEPAGLGQSTLGESLGRALKELAAARASQAELRVAVAFLLQIQIEEVVSDMPGLKLSKRSGFADEAVFAALLPALLDDAWGDLGELLSLSRDDRAALQQRAEQRRQEVGDEGMKAASLFLSRTN